VEFGLIGLARSGKTTVFDALTGGHAPAGGHEAGAPHVGVVKLPDPRLDELVAHFKPKKSTRADVRYLDFPGAGFARGFGREGASAAVLNALAGSDALIHVVRAFRSERVSHPEGGVDPPRDVATVDLELAFADLAFVQKRLERLDVAVRSAKAGERGAGEKEMALLERVKAGLEAEVPLHGQTLSADDWRLLENYPFLTAKPMLLLLNIDEDDASRAEEVEAEFRDRSAAPHRGVAALCAKIEMELGELSEEEAAEFRADMGLPESARELLVRRSFELLDLISFFTVNPEDGHAWVVPRGTTALAAAGKVHSDMERGFIRAEVLGWRELLDCGSLAEARKRGLLRLEGKQYEVQDGDVLHILFSV
jgi:GTP-binding protein YchF